MKNEEIVKALSEAIDEELIKVIAHAKSASWRWVTASEIVTRNPCILVYLILTAKGNACSLTLHDGVDTSAPTIVTLETTAAQSRPYAFHGHVMTQHGLYANLSGDVLGILICYHDVPKLLGG